MAAIRDVLAIKGKKVITVSPEASAFDATVLMMDLGIGSLLVVEDGRLVGMLTERDLLYHVVAEERDAQETSVGELMERDVVCCRPYTDMEEAKSVMKNRRVRHLPVMNDADELVGLVSIGDLNAYQTDSQERTIYLLEEYIHSTW
jgi:CBS domain-containing protein